MLTRAAKPKFHFISRNIRKIVIFGAATASFLALDAVIYLYFLFLNVAIVNCSYKPLTSKRRVYILIVLFVLLKYSFADKHVYTVKFKKRSNRTSTRPLIVALLNSRVTSTEFPSSWLHEHLDNAPSYMPHVAPRYVKAY